jgi:hypothetical protein
MVQSPAGNDVEIAHEVALGAPRREVRAGVVAEEGVGTGGAGCQE